MRAAQPGATPTVEHWPGILAGAGLTPCGTRAFLVDHPAPLDATAREVVLARWAGTLPRVGDRISAEDRAMVERLLDPDDEQGLNRRPDLFLLTATTVYAGRAPAA